MHVEKQLFSLNKDRVHALLGFHLSLYDWGAERSSVEKRLHIVRRARCSSVVRAFAHGAVGRRVGPS